MAIVALASFLASGSIAIFTFAYNLQAVPLTIIGVSYSVAAFPTLARLYAERQSARVCRTYRGGARHMIFWAVPATVFIIVLRAQLVRVILGAGAFDWSATSLTAAALALFIISLRAQGVSLLIARAYYAAGDTRKPLYCGVIDVVVSVGSAVVLVALFHSSPLCAILSSRCCASPTSPARPCSCSHSATALGSIAQCFVGFSFILRDFDHPARPALAA